MSHNERTVLTILSVGPVTFYAAQLWGKASVKALESLIQQGCVVEIDKTTDYLYNEYHLTLKGRELCGLR